MEQLLLTAMKPRVVPRRFFCAGMISRCSGFISGMTIGTSGVQRLALLLETTGVSLLAYSSSSASISSFFMSTAEKTKSTSPATEATSEASLMTILFAHSGIGTSSAQRLETASS